MQVLPGGTKQGFLLAPHPDVVGGNSNDLFPSAFAAPPALEEGQFGGGGMLLQEGKDVRFVPMGNAGDGEVQVQADSWG